MNSEQPTWIALLRGVGPGIRQIPMPDLCAVCVALGWSHVQSYIQSGNLVFQAHGAPAGLEVDLEGAIQARFGFEVPVIVRSAADWAGYVQTNPLRAIAEREPARVMLVLAKRPLVASIEREFQALATNGEHVARAGSALWIYFPNGAGRSKLSPGLLDRLVGSPVTTRNWRTVLRLQAMAGTMARQGEMEPHRP